MGVFRALEYDGRLVTEMEHLEASKLREAQIGRGGGHLQVLKWQQVVD